jgi:hypothetical protein
MRKAIRASVLVLLLTAPAQAGWMQNGSPEPPPPQPAPAVQGPTTDGQIDTPLTADGYMQNDASDGDMGNGAAATFAQVLLNLLALS